MANPWNSQDSLIWAMWNACEGEKVFKNRFKNLKVWAHLSLMCVCVNIENKEFTVDDMCWSDSSTFYILTYFKTLWAFSSFNSAHAAAPHLVLRSSPLEPHLSSSQRPDLMKKVKKRHDTSLIQMYMFCDICKYTMIYRWSSLHMHLVSLLNTIDPIWSLPMQTTRGCKKMLKAAVIIFRGLPSTSVEEGLQFP